MRDEIKIYQDGRYVSASEASHRLYGFDLHKEHPNVVRLAMHLKGRQTIMFQEGTHATAVLNRNPHTTLTAWFTFNKTTREHLNPFAPLHLAFNTLYHDFPRIATWKKKEKQWELRTWMLGLLPIGCMYFVQPFEGERYFLRYKSNMVSVCLSVVINKAGQGQGRAARADTRPQQVIFSYAWKSNSGGVYLCEECLEDSSSHCPFPVELPQM